MSESWVIGMSSQDLTLGELRRAYRQSFTVSFEEEIWEAIDASAQAVARIVNSGQPVYGINTGFGLLAQTRIPDADLTRLQTNLVLSHSTGVGDALDAPVVRLIILLKIRSLCQGYSGVRRVVIQSLAGLLRHDLLPVIPAKGSVGASGDLAPLAHMTAVLLGEGDVIHRGQRKTAAAALAELGIERLALAPKEGLALLNGTQVSTALCLAGLFECEDLFAAATMCGAASVDALKGSTAPFDSRIHELRRQPGQQRMAGQLRELMRGSDILASHIDCEKVQDPYSLRCQPQVMGACLDLMDNVARVLFNEANAVTDNPLIFAETDDSLSGGNFHAEPIAFAADTLALAIAEIASISERRIALLMDPSMNGGLPSFLVSDSGVNSGFMIAQVTAAALVSENKTLAHPASVDSIPTSANQEDHVSMATFAARRLRDMTENSINVVAIELLAACQALEFHAPSTTSEVLQKVQHQIRENVAFYDKDRFFAPDITVVQRIVSSGWFYDQFTDFLPSQCAR